VILTINVGERDNMNQEDINDLLWKNMPQWRKDQIKAELEDVIEYRPRENMFDVFFGKDYVIKTDTDIYNELMGCDKEIL